MKFRDHVIVCVWSHGQQYWTVDLIQT